MTRQLKDDFNRTAQAALDKALFTAAERGDAVEIADCIARGANPNSRDGSSGKTVLHYAMTATGSFAAIQTIIQLGADVDAPDASGKTVLHWAAEFEHIGAMVLLLKNKANINAQDREGKTPLHKAAEWAKSSVASLLVAKGADTTIRDHAGLTAMHAATRNGHVDTALKIREAISHKQSALIKAHALKKRKPA